MSQKYIKSQNKNSHNAKSFGKYYAKPVYDEKFVETDEIADFIQTQATLKRSDIKAALDELGAAMKHFLEMGQKIRLAGIGYHYVDLERDSAMLKQVWHCSCCLLGSQSFRPTGEP